MSRSDRKTRRGQRLSAKQQRAVDADRNTRKQARDDQSKTGADMGRGGQM